MVTLFPDPAQLDYRPPPALASLEEATSRLGFDMPSVAETGALLRALAGRTSSARILELGTGTGLATCWLLDGLDAHGTLVTVDNDGAVQQLARDYLGDDPRLRILTEDGADYLQRAATGSFDLVFADAWPGKFVDLERALDLLAPGGIYVGDDLLPQANWPEGHAARVPLFIEAVSARPDLEVEYRAWSSGILLARRRRD